MQILGNLGRVREALQTNAQSHFTMADRFQHMDMIKGDLLVGVPEGVASLATFSAQEETAPVTLPVAGEKAGEATEKAIEVARVAPWLVVLWHVGEAALAAGIILQMFHMEEVQTPPPPPESPKTHRPYPPGIDTPQQQALYDQFMTANEPDAFEAALVAMIVAGDAAATIQAKLPTIVLTSVKVPTKLQEQYTYLNGVGAIMFTEGVFEHIVAKHQYEFGCWNMPDITQDRKNFVLFVQMALQTLLTGLANHSDNIVNENADTDKGFKGFRIKSFKPGGFGPGGCPLVIIINPANGDVVNVYKPEYK